MGDSFITKVVGKVADDLEADRKRREREEFERYEAWLCSLSAEDLRIHGEYIMCNAADVESWTLERSLRRSQEEAAWTEASRWSADWVNQRSDRAVLGETGEAGTATGTTTRTLANHMKTAMALRREQRSIPRAVLPFAAGNWTEPTIQCRTNGTMMNAFPDSGADANYISEAEVRRQRLRVDSSRAADVQLASGHWTNTLGTVDLQFSFSVESKTYKLKCHVVKRCIQDLVIGSPFLQLTETLTKCWSRITQVFRRDGAFRIRLIGAPRQRLIGNMNGKPAVALPDTGADLSLASETYALESGWEIDRSPEHCIPLEFADGSTGRTNGVVKNLSWEFSSSPARSHLTDVYIYRDLECPLLLGYGFLRDSAAFEDHADSFERLDYKDPDSALGHLSIVKISQERADGGRTLRDLFKRKKVTTSTLVAAASQQDVVLPNTNVSFSAGDLQAYRRAEREMLRR